jgi:hypothetical protein
MSTTSQQHVTTEGSGASAGRKSFAVIALVAIVVGLGSILGGLGGIVYTWNNAAQEKITTPADARFAETAVRGPLTMWAQADIITKHQLDRTEGLRYAEMPRLIPSLDESGNPILDDAGEPVLVNNQARLSWIDATSLTTVLNLGLMAYMLSLFAIVMGVSVAGLGWVVLKLSRVPTLV